MIKFLFVTNGFTGCEKSGTEETSTAECDFITLFMKNTTFMNTITAKLTTEMTEITLKTLKMP
jgi:hypothetical protein